jgi:hypothetical protein
METNLFNGRVNILSKGYPEIDYAPMNSGPSSSASVKRDCDIVSNTEGHTPVSALFFSLKNINALQQGICNQVYNKSNGKYNVGKQSETELKIIMRSIYFESLSIGSPYVMQQIQRRSNIHEPLQPNSSIVIQQVRELNKKVLDWSVAKVLENVQQFDQYKKDVSTLPNPMDLPTLMSSSGRKTLEFQSFF